VAGFLSKGGPGLGIFELPEIMNTKATLRATELYLSSIMEWARKNRRARRILIVLEEAHTIIPETFGSGFDADTQFVVGRISQIALQGRKYGVGLLLVSQRTALVSKSILSQCNTHVTFSLVDKTSIDYLANVYSSQHVQAIPNLRFLEAVAYGKAIRSERPLLIKLKYDPAKKDASDALTQQVAEKIAS
jgi:DNA helicase HerA-like ATPase